MQLTLYKHSVAPMSTFRGLHERLGFAGLDRVDLPLVCALVTGDPLLLVGTHGTAKSALVRSLSRALDLRFHAYDASKSMFEDVLGFPDPTSLAKGELRYVPTPISLWDKEMVLIDEISRATPSMQSKWLEIVRGRRVMGLEAQRLKYVFAAMNPPQYAGAVPLDAALAGRFAWVVKMPDTASLPDAALASVVRTVSSEDAPLAPVFHSSQEFALEGLDEFLEAVRGEIPEVLSRYDDEVTQWVAALANCQDPDVGIESLLDGRRLSMIRRNALTAISVARASGDAVDLSSLLGEVLESSVPWPATGASDAVIVLHHRAFKARLEAQRPADALMRLRDPEQFVTRYLDISASLSPDDHDAALTRMFNAVREATDDDRVEVIGRALRVVQAMVRGPARFAPSAVERAMSKFEEMAPVDPNRNQYVPKTGPEGLSAAQSLALRVAGETAHVGIRRHYHMAIEDLDNHYNEFLPSFQQLLGGAQ